MKTIIFFLIAIVLFTSCNKSQDIIAPNKSLPQAKNTVGNIDTSKVQNESIHSSAANGMKRVTVDFSGFKFASSYSWTLTFKSTARHGETYVFRGDATRGYIHSEDMQKGSYEVTLEAKTSAGVSFIFAVFTKNENSRMTNDLDLELDYNETTASQTVQELASYYMSAATGR